MQAIQIRRIRILPGILVIMIGFTTLAFPQNPLRLGVTAGLNNANNNWPDRLIFDIELSSSSRLGFLAGLTAEYRLSNILYLHGEARYIQKGSELEEGDITDAEGNLIGEGMSHFDFDYLEFPLLLKLKYPVGKINPYVILGPGLGIKLSATNSFVVVRNDTGKEEELLNSDINGAKSTEFSVEGGAGVDIAVNKQLSIPVDIRYSKGLTKAWESLKSEGILITTGILIQL